MKILLLVLVMCLSWATNARSPIVISTGEYPPYSSVRLKHQGLIPHIITRAFAYEGMSVKFNFYPWKRAYRLSEKGLVDGTAPWLESSERHETHLYSDQILPEIYVWFYLKSVPLEWDSFSDLSSRSISAISGYTYSPSFYEAIKSIPLNVQFVTTLRQSFDLILNGRANVTLENIDVGWYYLRRFYPTSTVERFVTHNKPVIRGGSFLLISRKHPDAAKLISIFNRGLGALRESGELEKMIEDSRNGEYDLDGRS